MCFSRVDACSEFKAGPMYLIDRMDKSVPDVQITGLPSHRIPLWFLLWRVFPLEGLNIFNLVGIYL